jgi:hypothetical protein
MEESLMTYVDELLARYKPAMDAERRYPKDSHPLSVSNDLWEYANTRTDGVDGSQYPTDLDLYKDAKAESLKQLGRTDRGHYIALYKSKFIAKNGTLLPPFKDASMMISPIKWDTGFEKVTRERIASLGNYEKKADAIYEAIGVVNAEIYKVEALIVDARKKLESANETLGNKTAIKYMTEEEVKKLRNNIIQYEELVKAYTAELTPLRSNGHALNQGLQETLTFWKANARRLGLSDDYTKELSERYGSGFKWGGITGGGAGMIVAGLGIIALVQYYRRGRGVVSRPGRGANSLFMRN